MILLPEEYTDLNFFNGLGYVPTPPCDAILIVCRVCHWIASFWDRGVKRKGVATSGDGSRERGGFGRRDKRKLDVDTKEAIYVRIAIQVTVCPYASRDNELFTLYFYNDNEREGGIDDHYCWLGNLVEFPGSSSWVRNNYHALLILYRVFDHFAWMVRMAGWMESLLCTALYSLPRAPTSQFYSIDGTQEDTSELF